MPLSLGRDAATDTWGLAYTLTATDGASTIMLATSSDGGLTWKGQSISGNPFYGDLCHRPRNSPWNGSFYAVYLTRIIPFSLTADRSRKEADSNMLLANLPILQQSGRSSRSRSRTATRRSTIR